MIFVSLFINHYSSKLSDIRSINTSSTAVTAATISTANLSDPCYNYTVLDEPWRDINNTHYMHQYHKCDTNVTWSGWYRLFINGLSAHIPETCITAYGCGTHVTLWIPDGHPTVEDGVVTRDVCGHWDNYCCYYGSFPIKVKACPGNYYVYELVRPTVCSSAYCADVRSINTSSTAVTAATISTAILSDPCYNYTVLDDPWRATNNTYASVRNCDRSVIWSGWYRLFINRVSTQIPDTCVAQYSCGTDVTLWIPEGHPKVTDGVVTRDVCGHAVNYCCYYGSFPIKVKACPGNYYIYELVSPTVCNAVYCAVVLQPITSTTFTSSTSTASSTTTVTSTTSASSTTAVVLQPITSTTSTSSTSTVTSTTSTSSTSTSVTNIISTDTTVTAKTTLAVINITLQEGCTSQTSGGCFDNLFAQIENITAQVLPLDTVTNILSMAFNTSENILETSSSLSSSSSSSSANQDKLASYGNRMLKTSEKLISTLVKPTETSDNVNFTLPTVEGQVFIVGPQITLDKIPRLDTTNSSVDIDLIGIAKNNSERSAAVAFMSYNTMENLLKPDFFNTSNDTIKTMMSTVISATLPKTTNTKLTKPVNFTLRHIREFDPNGSLFCVYWNISEWIVDGCSVLKTNSSYTVCSCDHLSTFALIMQTSRPPESDSLMELLNLVCVIVGLVFFSLALLTFALCQWSPGVNNVARINICISLLLAHLLFLLTQQFLSLIRPLQVLCAVISGLLHFLFLSGFVWMFIEAVLLFICVENLSQISSINREVLSSGFLCVIGYVVSLVVVAVSVVVDPKGYGSEM
uniref:Uncharacterized protein n=1 Tax=Cyprinus carpio TaxID=7962 RepID=A0A8C2CEC0_CYPCA